MPWLVESSPSVPCDVLVTRKSRHSSRLLLFGSVSKKNWSMRQCREGTCSDMLITSL
jgi:hypothetical protein